MTLEPALDKKEMKEVFETVVDDLKKGIIKKLPLHFENQIQKAKEHPINLLGGKAIEFLNQSPINLDSRAKIKGNDGLWKIESPNLDLFLRKTDEGIHLIYKGRVKNLGVDTDEIKGIILEEIVKKDETMVFKGRDGLTITADSKEKINDELGDRKARHKRHKRLKKYKERVDNLMDREDMDVGED